MASKEQANKWGWKKENPEFKLLQVLTVKTFQSYFVWRTFSPLCLNCEDESVTKTSKVVTYNIRQTQT